MSALWGPPEFGASLGGQTLLWCSVPRLVTHSATLLQRLLWALQPVTSARSGVFKVRIKVRITILLLPIAVAVRSGHRLLFIRYNIYVKSKTPHL